MIEIVALVLGALMTNTYLLGDDASKDAVVIDPAGDGEAIAAEAEGRGWRISSIWYTHAHFDHLAGAAALADSLKTPPQVALHPEDYPLWRAQGGAIYFGMNIDPGPEPNVDLVDGMELHLGSNLLEVRHAPGHTRGHVIFYCPADRVAFVGDVIFQGSIGRTDLPGGDTETLMNSIRTRVLSLPDDTRLFSGHGPETNVGAERRWNPFLA